MSDFNENSFEKLISTKIRRLKRNNYSILFFFRLINSMVATTITAPPILIEIIIISSIGKLSSLGQGPLLSLNTFPLQSPRSSQQASFPETIL